jgi:ABC-2 type transport system ATP-binding protein
MSTIQVSNISKSFGALKAVDEVSFNIEPGEIFAMLGPNGAGKTTILRMVLDIFKPDQGQIEIFGGPISDAKKDRIGYMPEERGLYQDIPLERVLLYLASLKGMPASEARTRAAEYLERFDLAEHRNKKIKELSKGMQQKAQIIATLLHHPELLIIDEPFSGLDPVNTQMVKDLLRELHLQGVTIVMSTHQMHQVEELCERLLLIHRGRAVLYGRLADIRRQAATDDIIVRPLGPLPALAGVAQVLPQNHHTYRLSLEPGCRPQDVLRALVEQDIELESFEVAVPTLDEIFIQTVKDAREVEK